MSTYPAMLSYTSGRKNYALENLVSLLEYTGVILALWDEECAKAAKGGKVAIVQPSWILVTRVDDVAEIYISRSIDCGSNLPPTVFRCDTMRDIKRLYDEINQALNKPDLEPVFDRYMPLTGVSLRAAQRFLRMI